MIEYFLDTAFEISKTKGTPKGAIVFVDGLPSNPSTKGKAIAEWNKRSFDVVYPRYTGTWQSKGQFLASPPQDVLSDFCFALKNGLQTAEGVYKPERIYILGASFGGAVALSIKQGAPIDAVCVLSPVISFSAIPSLKTLPTYLKNEQSLNYRLDDKDFADLLEDRKLKPQNEFSLDVRSVLIVTGDSDDQIDSTFVKNFAFSRGIQFRLEAGTGHITLSKLSTSQYDLIANHFLSVS